MALALLKKAQVSPGARGGAVLVARVGNMVAAVGNPGDGSSATLIGGLDVGV